MSSLRHKVLYSAKSLQNLGDIVRFIHSQSPQNAVLVHQRLLSQIDSLELNPHRFTLVGRSRSLGTPVHRVEVSSYLVYYRVDPSPPVVHILSIIRGSRRQPKRFP